jgi:hypothetical protein
MCPPSRHVRTTRSKSVVFQHVQGPRRHRESSCAGVGLRRHQAQALAFDADGLSINNNGSMIKIDAIPGEAERFADAAASGHQKGEEVRYVMFATAGMAITIAQPFQQVTYRRSSVAPS